MLSRPLLPLLALLLAAPLRAADVDAKIPSVPTIDARLEAPQVALPSAALPTVPALSSLPAAADPGRAEAPPAFAPAAPAGAAPPAATGAGAFSPADAPRLAGAGTGAASANAASRGAAQSVRPEAAGDEAAAEAGQAFDLSARAPALRAMPVSAVELAAGRRSGLAPSKTSDASRLARLAQDVAAKRALRAARGEGALSKDDAAVLRGIDDLASAVALGRSTPRQLAAAARVVEAMDIGKLRRFSELASKFIDTDVPGKSTPFARIGNVEHVNQQLIDPLKEDGPELARAFNTNPRQSPDHFVEVLRALQYATDTGKQQNPDDLGAALARFNSQADTGPNWYVNNFILPHEYASMKWAESLGRQAGFSSWEVLAFKRLIANHNFGPDLTDPKNAAMRDHWWPKSFREQMLPMLAAMGVDVQKYFSRDEHGVLQYNSAQGHPYQLLLSAYDRAVAVKANGYGLATWKKYGTQDFNGKKSRLKAIREANANKGAGEALTPDPEGAKDPAGVAGEVFEFDGPSVIRAMEFAADTAEQHIESLWGSLYASLPADSPARRRFPTVSGAATGRLQREAGAGWTSFAPYHAQRQAIGRLTDTLRTVKRSNPEGMTDRADVVPQAGAAYYEAQSRELVGVYRVTLARVGRGARDPRSTDYAYEARLDVERGGPSGVRWEEARVPGVPSRGNDPVALFIDLIRRDKGW